MSSLLVATLCSRASMSVSVMSSEASFLLTPNFLCVVPVTLLWMHGRVLHSGLLDPTWPNHPSHAKSTKRRAVNTSRYVDLVGSFFFFLNSKSNPLTRYQEHDLGNVTSF